MPNRPYAAWRVPAVLLLMLGTSVVVSAWLSVLVGQWLAGAEEGVAGFIMEKGPHKVMRRLMMLLALPFLPWLLRELGWRGRSDCGWSRVPGRVLDAAWRRDLGVGFAVGVLSLGMMIVAGRLAGTLVAAPAGEWVRELPAVMAVAFSAVVIALLEETAVRGVLYRTLERMYHIWPAALASSVLFAYLHFMKAAPEVYGDGPVLAQTWDVIVSAVTGPIRRNDVQLRFVNLALMAVVLCLMVARTRTIWMAAGAHGAWVWVRRVNLAINDKMMEVNRAPWIGNRSDSTDSALTTVVLAALAIGVWFLVKPRRESE